MEIINSLLSIIGMLSIFLTIIRVVWMICTSRDVYLDHVAISVYDSEEDMLTNEKHFIPIGTEIGNQTYAQCNLFKPIDVQISKMTLSRIEFDSTYEVKNAKLTEIENFRDIKPDRPLCIKIERPEMVPEYALHWKSEYGAKTIYVFARNGYSGKYNQDVLVYQMNFIAWIRKLLGLK